MLILLKVTINNVGVPFFETQCMCVNFFGDVSTLYKCGALGQLKERSHNITTDIDWFSTKTHEILARANKPMGGQSW